MFSLNDLFIAMGFAWILSSSVQLLVNKKNKESEAVSEAIFLISIFGWTLVDNFIKTADTDNFLLTFILSVSRNSYFLIGPALLFYVSSLLSGRIKNVQKIVHLLPFFIATAYSLVSSAGLEPVIATGPKNVESIIFLRPGFKRESLALISQWGYSLYTFLLIRRHAGTVVDFYSRKTIQNTLFWLFYLIVFYIAFFTTDFFVLLFPGGSESQRLTVSMALRIIPSLSFIFLFSSFAQNQPIIRDEKVLDDVKYRNSAISDTDSKRIFAQIETILNKKKLYLDTDINLDDLAREAGETRHRVSEVINRESGQKFYSYINGFRLAEFISAVKENRFPDYTVIAIALECGFKSQSAFYNLFKAKTGMTPREFIKKET
ncbi:MAG: AraC family transcriptional regulator [Sphaerochaetaceae bacterium]|nr:AraC family transcriptional regulator [Sphaerochaetaceae bacterium]